MWFSDPHLSGERRSPTRLSMSGQTRYIAWSCRLGSNKQTNNTYYKIISRGTKPVLRSVNSATWHFLATVPITVHTHNYKKAPSIFSKFIFLNELNHKNTNATWRCAQHHKERRGNYFSANMFLESPGQMNSEKQPHNSVAEMDSVKSERPGRKKWWVEEGKPYVRTENTDKAKDAGKQFNYQSMVNLIWMSKCISSLIQTASTSHVV